MLSHQHHHLGHHRQQCASAGRVTWRRQQQQQRPTSQHCACQSVPCQQQLQRANISKIVCKAAKAPPAAPRSRSSNSNSSRGGDVVPVFDVDPQAAAAAQLADAAFKVTLPGC
jgi:hypothetical protein